MIPTSRPHLSVAACTDPGLSGKINEDRFSVTSYENRAGRQVTFAVIADGIGGHQAGEVAAALTVELIVEEVGRSSGEDPLGAMRAAIHTASQAIAADAARHEDFAGMGSTCACAWIDGNRLFTAYVGDSRIYLMRNGQLQRTSVDHTWIQEAIDRGLIDPSDAHDHPNAHVLRRHLGSPAPPLVDDRLRLNGADDDKTARANQGLELGPGELLVLCTDGLTDMLAEDKILKALSSRRGLKTLAEDLVHRANHAGGYDNTTVVLLQTPGARSRMAVGAGDNRTALQVRQAR